MSDNEQKNENRETVADILKEMRGMGNYQRYSGDHAHALADRIDAAWKRERSKIEADALAVGGIVEAARHKPVGNAAAKKHRRTRINDPSKIMQDYWRMHYEV